MAVELRRSTDWAENSFISVAPQLERLGLSLPLGVPLDHTLAALLEEEALRESRQILAPIQYCSVVPSPLGEECMRDRQRELGKRLAGKALPGLFTDAG